jgi:hypothetical protein
MLDFHLYTFTNVILAVDACAKELDHTAPKLKGSQRIRTKVGCAQQHNHRLKKAVSGSVDVDDLQPEMLANGCPKPRVARLKVALPFYKAGVGQFLCFEIH